VAGEYTEDGVVAEEDTKSLLVLHGFNDGLRLFDEVGQFRFAGRSVHQVMEIVLHILRELLTIGKFREEDLVQVVLADHVNAAGILPEE
jgi:hypothetical protein